MANNTNNSDLVRSYLYLRRAIGYLGITLPFMLLFGKIIIDGPGIEISLSDYYYTSMRDLFVGSLFAFGIFFWSYKGYANSHDDIAGNIASIGALGTALFPTMPKSPNIDQLAIGYIHYFFAITYLLTLAYFCIVLFTKTDSENPEPEKLLRNKIYRICGFTIIGSIIIIIAYNLVIRIWKISIPSWLDIVFWLETIAILAFGFSWIVKGKVLFKDLDN